MSTADAFDLGRAIGAMEFALVLLRVCALVLVGLGLFGMWQWRTSRWRG